MSERLYFAYGSNINLDQMSIRCPDARVIGPVTLEGYELLFRAGGVATIAPKEGETVHGLLWELTPECERALDLYEGFPRFYGKEDVTVRDSSGQEYTVMAYVMTRERMRGPNLPSKAYYEGIREGYHQNSIPTAPLTKALRHCQREVREMEKHKGGRGDGR